HLTLRKNLREASDLDIEAGQHVLGGIVLSTFGGRNDLFRACAVIAKSFAKRQMHVNGERPFHTLQILAKFSAAVIVAPGWCDRIGGMPRQRQAGVAPVDGPLIW